MTITSRGGNGNKIVNDFVSIKTADLVFRTGQYVVGEKIAAGEYYFWGSHISLIITAKLGTFRDGIFIRSDGDGRNTEIVTSNDSYITFCNGDMIIVECGEFTPVSNITYSWKQGDLLRPNHIYKIDDEIPRGYYMYAKKNSNNEEDTAFEKFEKYPHWTYKRDYGSFGFSETHKDEKYIRIKNGTALYYGTQLFNLYEILNSAIMPDNTFQRDGIAVMSSELCSIKVFQIDKQRYLYHGDVTAIISEQYLFSINAHNFWAGFLNVETFKFYHWVKLGIKDLLTEKQYCFGDNSLSTKGITNISFSQKDNPLQLLRGAKADFFLIKLSPQVHMNGICIEWVYPECSSEKLYRATSDIQSIYSKELEKIRVVLQKYRDIGLKIDIAKEIEYLYKAPDFISVCSAFLEEHLKNKPLYDGKSGDGSRHFTFRVAATYDKEFYCAAKLADNADDINANVDNTVYYVTFTGLQIEEIDLMCYNLQNAFNAAWEDLVVADDYLCEYDFFNYLQKEIDDFIAELRAEHGYSSFVTNSVLVSINKAILKNKRKKLNKLYTAMAKENRITTKWSTEYKLFSLISNYVDNVVYQYRADWLGQQSFDIFIPSQNIAIEYQGLQHYEAVDVFGGEEALTYNKARDKRKSELSIKHNVKIFYWKYDVPVEKWSVLQFLSDNAIDYSVPCDKETQNGAELIAGNIEMAPVIKEEYPKKERTKTLSPFVVRQYTKDGVFLNQYASLSEAASESSVSETGINKVIYNARNTAGGFIWRRCPRNSEVVNIASAGATKSSRLAKRVFQISTIGELLSEYDSIGQAEKVTGVNRRSISDALSGVQKTAGGYLWKYADAE